MIPDPIRELIDACSDEQMLANDVRMQPLRDWIAENHLHKECFDRVRAMDFEIGNAFREVPVPVGLKDRIRQRIHLDTIHVDTAANPETEQLSGQVVECKFPSNGFAESLDSALAPFESNVAAEDDLSDRHLVCEDVVGKSSPQRVKSRRVRTRRWKATSLAGVAASLLIIASIAVYQGWFNKQNPVADHNVKPAPIEVIGWAKTIPEVARWNHDLSNRPEGYAYSPDLKVPAVAWSPFEIKHDPDSIVYDCTPEGKEHTYLFVFRSEETWDLPRIMPNQPDYRAEGYCVAGSHDENVVYMLVVLGDVATYRQRINPAPGIVMNQSGSNSREGLSANYLAAISQIDQWLSANAVIQK